MYFSYFNIFALDGHGRVPGLLFSLGLGISLCLGLGFRLGLGLGFGLSLVLVLGLALSLHSTLGNMMSQQPVGAGVRAPLRI